MDERTKQELKKLAQSSKKTLKTIGHETKKAATAVNGYYTAKWQNEQEIRKRNLQIEIMNQIRWELFSVFEQKNYPYLEPVQIESDIIPLGNLKYEITLRSENLTPPAYGLRQGIEKINMDIYYFKQWIIANYPLQDAWNIHPNIMSGMYVADIKANGIYAVLTIAFPQK